MFEWQSTKTGDGGIAEVWRNAPGSVKAAVAVAAGAVSLVVWLAYGGASASLDGVSGEPVGGEVLGATATAAAEPAEVVVHVVGAVRHPGVYAAPLGSRVGDVIERAGGALGNAALEAINLARVVVDGEQIYVPTSDEASAAAAADHGFPPTGPAGGRRVNLNTATAEELDGLPGIGPATAQKIVDDRARNGPFASPEDLMRVPGIGPKKFDALKDLVTTR